MNKSESFIKRVVKRLADIKPARKQREHPELVPVEGRSDGEPREPPELESVEGGSHGEQRERTELVPAEGRYYGG